MEEEEKDTSKNHSQVVAGVNDWMSRLQAIREHT
jgi:hypothetical protein